jgi:uncharacterized damage-inducible protein DinB
MTQEEIDNKHNEITAKVSSMSLTQLANHLVDHAGWYSEYTESAASEGDSEYWQMQTEAAILAEAANRLLQVERLGRILDKAERDANK